MISRQEKRNVRWLQMDRDIVKINLKLLNSYKAEIDLLFEQIMVLESILECDDINYFDYVEQADRLGIQRNRISKPTEMSIFSKYKKVSKDSIRIDIHDMASKLNKLILVVEAIENVYFNLQDDYKLVFELSFKNDFYDYDTKLKVFKERLQLTSDDKVLRKKYENIKTRLIDIFMKDIDVIELIKHL